MRLATSIHAADQHLLARLEGFVPDEVIDVHAHFVDPEHFEPTGLPFETTQTLGQAPYRIALERWLTSRLTGVLGFGFPVAGTDRGTINDFVLGEASRFGVAGRTLLVAAPEDDPTVLAEQLTDGRACGLKPYNVFSVRGLQARVEEFAPPWMWELCDATDGILMLHLVRDRAIADPSNQECLRDFARRYPRCRVVLAHVGRCFSHRHALDGLAAIVDLENVVVDTSAVTEAASLRTALDLLGPKRVLFGSDYPVSEFRGRCVTVGDGFVWLYEESTHAGGELTEDETALVGLESLMALKEACDELGLGRAEIDDVFSGNARRLLRLGCVEPAGAGQRLWQRAQLVIAGGTGLLSKRAELYDPVSWPSYFSRCEGSMVWDLDGHLLVDFAGGIGAVLLGYADRDVTIAVKRRLALGTYCTLATPDEVALADLLLELHPWAGRIQLARGGGEAMTVAVRIARAATGRSKVAICGYHGWHDWYLAANLASADALDAILIPGLDPAGVPGELAGTAATFRFNDVDSLHQALERLGEAPAAIVMEPMRSERPQPAFLEAVEDARISTGALLVLDEITSGWRFGFPGAHAVTSVVPDLAVYAKAMSNGFPCAAIVGTEDVMEAGTHSFISSSYWTDGVGPAAALACIEKLRRLDVQPVVWARGLRLQAGLRDLAARHPSLELSVGGMPAAPSLSFGAGPAVSVAWTRAMIEQGFLVSEQLYLMHAHTEPEIDRFLEVSDTVFGAVGELVERGGLFDGGPDQRVGRFGRLA